MTDWIEMSEPEKLAIGAYLHKKFMERSEAIPYGEPKYSMEQFARDIGIDADTLRAIYNNREGSGKMQFSILKKLIAYFGKDFTDAMGLTPPAVPGIKR